MSWIFARILVSGAILRDGDKDEVFVHSNVAIVAVPVSP